MANKNTKVISLSNYFELSGPSQYTAIMPQEVDLEFGISNIIVEFSDTPTKTLNVIINFLFSDPASTFYQQNALVLAGDLEFDNIPINVGVVINFDYEFSTEDEFLRFAANFIADNRIELKYK